MSKSRFIKLSGPAFILGSFGFLTLIVKSDELALAGSVISSILLAAGMLGLRARHGENAGGFGRNILLAGVIGMVLLYVILASLALLYSAGILSAMRIQLSSSLWILLFGGPAVLLSALTLFGLAALRSKPMVRLNWLPVFAGIWYPVFYFFLFGYLFTRNGVYPAQYQTGFDVLFLVQFIALCTFGAVLAADIPREMAAA